MAEPRLEDELNSAFSQEQDSMDTLFSLLILSSCLLGINNVSKRIPEKDKPKLEQANQDRIKSKGKVIVKEKLPEQFSFIHYGIDGKPTSMIISDTKQFLIKEYGLKEADFKGLTVVNEGQMTRLFGEILPKIEPAFIGEKAVGYIIDEKQLNRFFQQLEDHKMLGRLEDPKTIENLSFRNSQRINDMIGQYGSIEGYKKGYLGAAAKAGVLVHWIPAGANTCPTCNRYSREGPYLPKYMGKAGNPLYKVYPYVPHYGCECKPGTPVPMGVNRYGVYQKYPQRFGTGDLNS